MEHEFRSFKSIESFYGPCTIWEKIDGSNAQIYIYEEDGRTEVKAGSRNKWITVDDDNFGFAKWVDSNKQALIDIFGVGRFYGEWMGGSIQRKYGFKEKRFVVFHHEQVEGKVLLQDMILCPVLYKGDYREGIVQEIMDKLKSGGSYLAPGFMNPEGIVIRFNRNGAVFKKVFKESFVPRVKDRPIRKEIDPEIINSFLQEDRLNSVLSKDEKYRTEYPKSLALIASAYVGDLEKESFEPIDEEVFKAVKRKVFLWIKGIMDEKK